MKKIVSMIIAIGLTGCVGSFSKNSDRPAGSGLKPRKEATTTAIIQILPTGPTGKTLTATSCKNLLWDPSPSRKSALALLKDQAKSNGYNAIHSVQELKKGTSLATNCWSSITLIGIGFIKE